MGQQTPRLPELGEVIQTGVLTPLLPERISVAAVRGATRPANQSRCHLARLGHSEDSDQSRTTSDRNQIRPDENQIRPDRNQIRPDRNQIRSYSVFFPACAGGADGCGLAGVVGTWKGRGGIAAGNSGQQIYRSCIAGICKQYKTGWTVVAVDVVSVVVVVIVVWAE